MPMSVVLKLFTDRLIATNYWTALVSQLLPGVFTIGQVGIRSLPVYYIHNMVDIHVVHYLFSCSKHTIMIIGIMHLVQLVISTIILYSMLLAVRMFMFLNGKLLWSCL